MLTFMNIMPRLQAALAQRLEALTGQEASCCVADYQELVERARSAPAFDRALARAKAMSDEKRLLALAFLKRRGREACACEIQAALDLTHGTVSHHMAVLEEAGLVAVERRGRWAYYSLTKDAREVTP